MQILRKEAPSNLYQACGECGGGSRHLVRVEDQYEVSSFTICRKCVEKAVDLFDNEEE